MLIYRSVVNHICKTLYGRIWSNTTSWTFWLCSEKLVTQDLNVKMSKIMPRRHLLLLSHLHIIPPSLVTPSKGWQGFFFPPSFPLVLDDFLFVRLHFCQAPLELAWGLSRRTWHFRLLQPLTCYICTFLFHFFFFTGSFMTHTFEENSANSVLARQSLLVANTSRSHKSKPHAASKNNWTSLPLPRLWPHRRGRQLRNTYPSQIVLSVLTSHSSPPVTEPSFCRAVSFHLHGNLIT